MRIVDSHLHLWDLSTGDYTWNTPDAGRVHASFDDAQGKAVLDSGGVDTAVLVQAADTDRDTEAMLSVARAKPWAAGVVAWVPLEDPAGASERLQRWQADSSPVVGVRQLIQDDPRDDLLDRPAVRATLRRVEAAGLPVDVPDAWPRLWPALTRLTDAMPGLTVVVDHLGKPDLAGDDADPADRERWLGDLADLARRPNVMAKVSALGQVRDDWLRESMERVVEAFGPSRLMFGGDWPVSLTHREYPQTISTALAALDWLSPSECDQVLSGTATRVYGLAADLTRASA